VASYSEGKRLRTVGDRVPQFLDRDLGFLYEKFVGLVGELCAWMQSSSADTGAAAITRRVTSVLRHMISRPCRTSIRYVEIGGVATIVYG